MPHHDHREHYYLCITRGADGRAYILNDTRWVRGWTHRNGRTYPQNYQFEGEHRVYHVQSGMPRDEALQVVIAWDSKHCMGVDDGCIVTCRLD